MEFFIFILVLSASFVYYFYDKQKIKNLRETKENHESKHDNPFINEVDLILQKYPIIKNNWLKIKTSNENFYYFDKNYSFETNHDLKILKYLYDSQKDHWKFQALCEFYKNLEIPDKFLVIPQIIKNKYPKENFSDLGILPLLYSKKYEYKKEKNDLIHTEKKSKFIEKSLIYLNEMNLENLKILFSEIDVEQKIWIFPLFNNFEIPKVLDFLISYEINEQGIYNSYLEKEMNEFFKKSIINFIEPKDLECTLCTTCLQKPLIKTIKELQYLYCKNCENTIHLQCYKFSKVGIIGKKINDKEIIVWDKIHKQVRFVDVETIILRFEKNIDFDWALTSFLHEFELHFPQKTINIVIENVHLQENTLRMIQDQVKFNLVIQK